MLSEVLSEPSGQDSGCKWQQSHAKLRESLGLCEQDRWSRQHGRHGLPYGERVSDTIDLAWQQHVALSRRNGEPSPSLQLVLDTSQSSYRSAVAPTFRSIVCNSTFFAFARNRMVHPREHMRILGWPEEYIPDCSASQLRDLSGESMAMPSIAGIFASVVANMPGIWSD